MPDRPRGPLPLSGPAWARWTATAGGLGLLHPAPGTWGSLGAGAVAWTILASSPAELITPLLALLAFLAATVGAWAVHRVLTAPGCPCADPPQVVIDEVLGVWLALCCVPPAVSVASPVTTLIVAVLMFRILDIAKPFPIAAVERLPGAVGVMADDALAGLLAGLTTTALLG